MQAIKGFCLFVKEIFVHPKRVGAIAPSSKNLAQRMVSLIHYVPTTLVVELGAGTGAITQALLESNIPNKNIIVIERSPKMVTFLKNRFPNLTVIQGDAQDLDVLIKKFSLPVSAIVSSLPLRSLPKEVVANIENVTQKVLMPTGAFIQYTYDLRKSSSSPLLNLKKISSEKVWLNVPPAQIDVYKK